MEILCRVEDFRKAVCFSISPRRCGWGRTQSTFSIPAALKDVTANKPVLCPVKIGEAITRKRDAQKLLQPYLDRVNSSLSAPVRERKNASFEGFAKIWERDYLSLSKPSTQSSITGHLRRLEKALGPKDMRKIDAGDIQRIISAMDSEGLDPKTIRNLWGIVSLIWAAALSQKYVDSALPKPKLPRKLKKKTKILHSDRSRQRSVMASQGEQKVFYWLAAETGLRAGELAGLRLIDIADERLTVNQSVWHGKVQDPKTDNAVRTLARLAPAHHTALGTDRTAEGKAARIFVFCLYRGSVGHERIPSSQDANAAQVSRDSAGRVPRLPTLQRRVA